MPETDSVLTSSEICDLLAEHGTRLQDTPAAPLDAFPGAPASDVTRSWPGGSGTAWLLSCSGVWACQALEVTCMPHACFMIPLQFARSTAGAAA